MMDTMHLNHLHLLPLGLTLAGLIIWFVVTSLWRTRKRSRFILPMDKLLPQFRLKNWHESTFGNWNIPRDQWRWSHRSSKDGEQPAESKDG